jgi:hypothetical protein
MDKHDKDDLVILQISRVTEMSDSGEELAGLTCEPTWKMGKG